MKPVKAQGIDVLIYRSAIFEIQFFGSKVACNIDAFKEGCDNIIANRMALALTGERDKISRTICSGQIELRTHRIQFEGNDNWAIKK